MENFCFRFIELNILRRVKKNKSLEKLPHLLDQVQLTVKGSSNIVVVAIVNNQKSRLILNNMEVLHWRVSDPFAQSQDWLISTHSYMIK